MRDPSQMRILVVDDHEVVHWGLRALLGSQPWVGRCLTAAGSDQALELARRYEPHVAVIDLFLGSESGAELGEEIARASPTTRVLLISGAGTISPHAARAAGASGFVSKESGAREVMKAIRRVGQGQTVFEAQPREQPAGLSSREREVLAEMAGGATNREIAAHLYMSPNTVKDHTRALYRKLGARNRTEAVQRAQRLGLLA
jgi:two-component system response regulator DesR